MGLRVGRWIFVVLVLVTFCGCLDTKRDTLALDITEEGESEEVAFFIASDIHYLAPELRDNGAAFQKFSSSGDGKELGYIEEITTAFVRDIKAKKPDVVILSGDLTMNGEKKSHEMLAQKLREIDADVTRIFVIPGNHDVLNPYARRFQGDKQYAAEYVTPEEFATVYEEFGYGQNHIVLRDEDSLSYLAEASEQIWLLMLDSCVYEENIEKYQPQTRGEVRDKTLRWIETCAVRAKEEKKEIVVVTHHNLVDHNEVIRDGFTLDNNQALLALLTKYEIPLHFSGHIHVQDIASSEGQAPYDIASGSLAVYPQKYGVLTFGTNWLYTTQWVDVEGYAKETGSIDQNLLAFQSYAKQKFLDKSRDMVGFFEDMDLTEQQQNACTELIGELNCRYFAGEEIDESELIESEAYQILSGMDGFVSRYVKSIAVDTDMDDNHLVIPIP